MTDNIVITNKDTRIIINDKGGYKLVVPYELMSEEIFRSPNFSKRDRIIRNRTLPKWCCEALKDGKWIDVSSIEINGDYAVVRGKAISPNRTTETRSKDVGSWGRGEVYWQKLRIAEERIILSYKDCKECSSWKEVNREVLTTISEEERKAFEAANPLPKNDLRQYVEIVGKPVEYDLEDDGAIKKYCRLTKNHEEGVWYKYGIDEENAKLIIEKHNRNYDSTPNKICIGKTKVLYDSKKYIRTYETTRESSKYESEDQMGWRSDTYVYRVDEYKVVIEGNDMIYKKLTFLYGY